MTNTFFASTSKTTFNELRNELNTAEPSQSKEKTPTSPTKELTENIFCVSSNKLLIIKYVCSVSGKNESNNSAKKELKKFVSKNKFVM